MFERIGAVRYPPETASADEVFEAALEAGAADLESSEDGHEVLCAPEDLNDVREALEARFASPEAAELAWRPSSTVDVDEAGAEKLFRLLEALEENDDVQSVAANFSVADEVMARLTG